MTEGQALALRQLGEVVDAAHGRVEVRSAPAEQNDGRLRLELSLDCRRFDARPGGLRLHEREPMIVRIPADFPFMHPAVETPHTRFAGHTHVLWSRYPCLYLPGAPEWLPQDGMYGFLERLEQWLRAGARNEWEEEGAPLHPPISRIGKDTPLIVPRVDAPQLHAEEPFWLGFAEIAEPHDRRIDIVGWKEFDEETAPPAAPAILLAEPFPWEYPRTIGALVGELERAGVARTAVPLLMKVAVSVNGADKPIRVVIGSPMRGTQGGERIQHLMVWELESDLSEIVEGTLYEASDTAELKRARDALADRLIPVLETYPARWCTVREARPEVLQRRDRFSPMSWLAGKHAAVWGCGALGGYAALALARANVARLTLCDKGMVAPGLLVRQPYKDLDVGFPKAVALKVHVEAANPAVEVDIDTTDLVTGALSSDGWTKGVDVIIDASASRLVQGRSELQRWIDGANRAPLVSMVVDSKAERGMLTVAPAGFSGGSADLTRKAKVRLSRDPEGQGYLDAFWPDGEPHLFLPEPGCSAPTFAGSAADSMYLTAAMLNCAMKELARQTDEGAVYLVTAPHLQLRGDEGAHTRVLRWAPDVVIPDGSSNYEVRLSASAWRSIRGWIVEGARSCGESVETGGVLFGEKDDASRIVWVDDATGPPPDSAQSPDEFICGVEGVQEAGEAKAKQSGRTVHFVGMWHTHPATEAIPSPRDVGGMKRILTESELSPKGALLLIVGGTAAEFKPEHLGAYVFKREAFNDDFISCGPSLVEPQSIAGNPGRGPVGLTLSGGGARAMAFHLGCLRALDDLELLDKIRVVSAVSGGAVLAALYAYCEDDFTDFEQRVRHILRQGLQGKILRQSLKPWNVLRSLGVAAGPGLVAFLANATRGGLRRVLGLARLRDLGTASWVDHLEPPFPRSWSRTSAFEAVLARDLFPKLSLTSPRRHDLDVVFNATDLRTLSAVRFGSRESGCWRYGRLANNSSVSVAHAVACSAAFPLLLPAVDRRYRFEKNGEQTDRRLILTDGGAYDNLGVTCLQPGRDPTISYNVFPVEWVIACDAGAGLPSGRNRPFWWPRRVSRAFDSTYRQVQHGAQGRLHNDAASGRLEGFIYAYLGTREQSLPYVPGDWVPRGAVMEYPTDFAPMSEEIIDRLSGRGDRLIRLLFEHYAPHI